MKIMTLQSKLIVGTNETGILAKYETILKSLE
jgi:hypothetical protein